MAPNYNPTNDGIFQSVSGKAHPSFRQEDQHMAEELKPVVVGPPGYTSPDPNTLAGKLVSVEEHPLSGDISDDYGASVQGATDSYQTSLAPIDGDNAPSNAPENRDDWTKANWADQAKSYGLPVGGTKDQLRERVEAYEGEVEADKKLQANEWIEEIENAEDADDLASIRERYGMAGANYTTVDSAFEAKQAEFDGNGS